MADVCLVMQWLDCENRGIVLGASVDLETAKSYAAGVDRALGSVWCEAVPLLPVAK